LQKTHRNTRLKNKHAVELAPGADIIGNGMISPKPCGAWAGIKAQKFLNIYENENIEVFAF